MKSSVNVKVLKDLRHNDLEEPSAESVGRPLAEVLDSAIQPTS